MKPSRLWLYIAAACLIAGALDVLQMRLQGTTSWSTLLFQGAEWILLMLLTPITYYLGRRYPLRRGQLRRTLPIHFAGALLLCFGWATFGIIIRRALRAWGPNENPFLVDWGNWLLTSLPWSFFLYFAVLGCVYAFTYYVEARDREAQAERLNAQLADARLSALRMQIQPHFLFNSLNAILVLVRDQETKRAGTMLELLSDMLRQVLRTDQPHEVTLDQELSLVDQYLSIEQVRFSDRLQIRYDIPDDLRSAAVPRFILQPLVENALRHGVAQRLDTVLVEVGARRSGDLLELWVRDNGAGLAADRRAGVGLENTRLRLTTLYGDRSSLELNAVAEGGTIARIVMPYRQLES